MLLLYALLLALYPRAFRERWRAELLLTAEDALQHAREHGWRARLSTMWWLLRDVVGTLPGAWRDVLLPSPGERTSRRGATMLATIGQDLRYAMRAVFAAPLFHGAAVLTLGVCTGATIAVFSVLNGVLLRPLSYPEEARLVHIEGDSEILSGITYPVHALIAERARSFDLVSAWQGWAATVRDPEGISTRLTAASVSPVFFELLGVKPQLGQFFAPEHGRSGHEPVVVLSHELWRTQFAGARDVVGRFLPVDTVMYRVVGVAPPGFADPQRADVVMWRAHPPAFDQGLATPGWVGFWAIGRLRAGVTLPQASAEVRQLVTAEYGDLTKSSYRQLASFRDAVVRNVRPTLIALLAAVGCVLLIGCANVANLLLSRATVRTSEMALRSTLGASRSRLVSQLLNEGLLLSVLGTGLGLLIALSTTRVLVRMFGSQLPRVEEVGIDWRVAGFAFALAVLTAIAFALAPAMQLTRLNWSHVLRESGRGVAGRSGQNLRRTLVVLETALGIVLLTGAGLLVRTLWQLQQIDPGFDAEAVTYARLGLPAAQIGSAEQQVVTVERALLLTSAIPGVSAAGAITDLPMSGAVNSTTVRRAEDANEEGGLTTLVRAVAGDYFGVMGVPLRRGRVFTPADAPGSAEIALVNEEFARRMYDGADPLGQVVVVRGVPRQIVGVVGAVQEFTLTGTRDAALYTPFAQEREDWMREAVTFVLRAPAEAPPASASVRATLRQANALVTVGEPATLRTFVERDIASPRARALLVALFAVLAVLLAALGIGSVIAYNVAQRLPELGVRMALGARPGDVVRLVLGESVRLVGLGVLVGSVAALAAGQLIARFLYAVSPVDPLALGVSIVTLLLAGVGAAVAPARRGATVDPASVLRG